jgi:hypothetical protein
LRGFFLKTGTTVLTVGATVLSALFVTSHMKNPSAPLQPPVNSAGKTVSVGSVTIGPSVHSSDVQPVTSTYAS